MTRIRLCALLLLVSAWHRPGASSDEQGKRADRAITPTIAARSP